MKTLRLVLGDQLTEHISSLRDIDSNNDVILMCEVWEEATYVKHHKKKIAFLFSAMRHFAEGLKKANYNVIYVKLDDHKNKESFFTVVERVVKSKKISSLIVTHPGEYRVLKDMKTWPKKLKIPVEIRDDERYLCTKKEFIDWASSRKKLRMEYFYHYMRKKYDILMKKGKPIGGKWNYDSDNRKPPNLKLSPPKPLSFRPDTITKQVISLVEKKFPNHFGDIKCFNLAVTRKNALKQLKHFVAHRLKYFGDYQDAMIQEQPYMYHSMLSFYLNCGLLDPRECIEAVQDAYYRGDAAINSAEAFIRQILGWREYVRGVYWFEMPKYKKENYLNAQRKLPDFFWTGYTKLNCLKQCINETKKNAYAHHIQRLMILGNFLLLIGADPKEVNEWYLIVYADAYEWVELPNVTGMILFADGGVLASKPYAAGGSYINKMSNYCESCEYKVSLKTGQEACPFNYLYWNFLIINKIKLKNNPRLAMMYATLQKMDQAKIKLIKKDSELFFQSL